VSVEDVREGPRREKIVAVSINEKFDCPQLEFESGDVFSLNVTNTRIMNRAYGPESDYWINQIIDLCLGHYTDNKDGKEKETVTVHPVSVRQPSPDDGGEKAKASRRDDLSDDIPF
jgi:hypothetical protein